MRFDLEPTLVNIRGNSRLAGKVAKRTLMFVFGTRPEAIKLAPLILKAKERSSTLRTIVVATAQHRQMLDDVLATFDVKPDVDLNIMAPEQSLFYITAKTFTEMEQLLSHLQPDVLIVQGDTTTTFAAALAGFYAGMRIAHVEAGLRTGNKWAPFPEEINRKITSVVADYHFAPTERAKKNLLNEGYDEKRIHVTGNTVIDALLWVVERVKNIPCPISDCSEALDRYARLVLITGHRRENFGEPFRRICGAFKHLALRNPDVCFIYPVHLNPNVQAPVMSVLDGLENFLLLPPLPYPQFVWLMQKAYFVITDSGGIQEEAPALAKPVLVTRRVTERPEAVEHGVAKLVGDSSEEIITRAQRLLDDETFYMSMAKGVSPYGDGKSCERILRILLEDSET